MKRFAIVTLFYEPSRVTRTVELIRSIGRLANVVEHVAVINGDLYDEAGKDIIRTRGNAREVIQHDNRGMEFGAYQVGLDHLTSDYDCLIVMNDTVNYHTYIGPELLNLMVSLSSAPSFENAMGGYVCNTPRRVIIEGLSATRFVRSNFLFMDAAAVRSIDRRIYVESLDRLVDEDPAHPSFFDASLHESAVRHVSNWLFIPGPEAWYKAQPLTAENRGFMARKARSILQEFYLSMRLEQAFGAVVHPNYTFRARMTDKLWKPRIVGAGNAVPL